MSELLRGFPVTVEIPVAWGEMDAFGHVNNMVYFRYFETARIRYFEAVGYIDLAGPAGTGPILAYADCRFRLPLTYPDRVRVGARVSDVSEAGFLMHYRAVSLHHRKVAAEGTGRITSFDYDRQAKAPLPPGVAEAIARLEAGAGD
ncbi:MAG: thioesterase family protein [Gammaproteobacteria bacterium]